MGQSPHRPAIPLAYTFSELERYITEAPMRLIQTTKPIQQGNICKKQTNKQQTCFMKTNKAEKASSPSIFFFLLAFLFQDSTTKYYETNMRLCTQGKIHGHNDATARPAFPSHLDARRARGTARSRRVIGSIGRRNASHFETESASV